MSEQKYLQQIKSLEQKLNLEAESAQKTQEKSKEKIEAFKKKLSQYKEKN